MSATAEAYREAARFLTTLDCDRTADVLIVEANRLDREHARLEQLGELIFKAAEDYEWVVVAKRTIALVTEYQTNATETSTTP